MSSLVQQLQRLPAFLLAVGVFYWSLPLMVLTYAPLMSARMKGPRQDAYVWSMFMKTFFRLKVLKYGTHSLYKGKGNILYLCNHRSWADFFIDLYLTEGNSALMSRWLVYFVFPVFMTSVRIVKGVVLFKRGHIADKQAFNKWIDEQLASSPIPGLLVFPEGHRSTKPTSLPLKRGMMHYAHSRGMPVQIIITRNKEEVMSEKKRTATWGATVVASYSQVIETKGVSFEEFAKKVQDTWDTMWKDVYAADAAGLPELVHEQVPQFEYTKDMRQQQCVAAYSSIPLMCGVFAGCFQLFFWVTQALGVMLQKALLAGIVTLFGWSLMSSWK